MLSEVGQGDYNRRDSTVAGVKETSALEARGYDRGTASRPQSPGVGSEVVFPPLRKCQSEKASKRTK